MTDAGTRFMYATGGKDLLSIKCNNLMLNRSKVFAADASCNAPR